MIEKLLYFVPFAVLLPAAGWLLAREIMGRTRWTLLAPVLLLGNTYFMLEADGEVPLALGEVISFLALIAFLRTMRRRSLGWAVVAGLLVAVTATFDIRPAYLAAVLMAMYFVVATVIDRDWGLVREQVRLGAVAAAVFIGCQAYWLVPLLTYRGNPAELHHPHTRPRHRRGRHVVDGRAERAIRAGPAEPGLHDHPAAGLDAVAGSACHA